jgi:hypothetical protein
MPLNKSEIEWIKLTARELAFQAIKETLAEHIKSCPHGLSLMKAKWLLIGISIAPTIGGCGLGLLLARMFGT